MESNILQVKNVICRRCKITVREIFIRLEIPFRKISLGEVVLKKPLKLEEMNILQKEFDKVGFEIIEDKNERIVNKIKSIVIKEVYEDDLFPKKKLSEILTAGLYYDYSYLSTLFSNIEGISIGKFQSNIRIERIKELLEYGELNINEIAAQVGYKSASYLCTKFKDATGFTPLTYQKKHIKKRVGIDVL